MITQQRRGDVGFAVYIGDLNLEATEEDLTKAFSPYGEIVSTKVIRYPPEHVVSKGYGKVAVKGSLVAIQMGSRRKPGPGIDSQLAATSMVTPSPYSSTQYFQDPSTGQLYMMPQYASAFTSGMPTMAATYPAMQPMYYQQPMQMMTIAPTMPQMAFQQPAPPVAVAIAPKQVAVVPKPGVLPPAGNQQMSLTMSASAPVQAATQQPSPQAQPAPVLPGQAQLGTRQPAPHTGQPPQRQLLPPYPNVQPVLRAPSRPSNARPDPVQPDQVQGHSVQPSPLNNRPPHPNRSSPLPNQPPPSFAPPQPGNQIGGPASISGIANGKQNIQRFSPY